jgi:hypothetical protein
MQYLRVLLVIVICAIFVYGAERPANTDSTRVDTIRRELLWVIGLVLSGFNIKPFVVKVTLMWILALSICTTGYFISKFIVSLYRGTNDKMVELSKCTTKIVKESFWIFILVFSGVFIGAWFLPLPEEVVFTWKDYISYPSAIFLLSIAIVITKIILIIKPNKEAVK